MRLTENCFAVVGLGCYPPWTVNSGFVTGRETTLIVDAGPNYQSALTISGYSEIAAPRNKSFLINTEKHLDHLGGNCFFSRRGIDIFGHPGINRNDEDLKDDKNYFNLCIRDDIRRIAHEEEIFYEDIKIVNPGIAVHDGQKFDLGGGIEATVIFTPGHTTTNISIFIPRERVIYCGDLVVSGYLPNLEEGKIDDWNRWLISLDLVLSLKPEYLVPGHGKVLSGENVKKEADRIKLTIKRAIGMI